MNISTSQSSAGSYGEEEDIWLKTGVYVIDLPDAQLFPPQYQYTVTGKVRKKVNSKSTAVGRKLELNGKEIALFRYADRIYAVEEACPHMGGPLHLGDIEDIDGQICVACPWHNWRFNLENGTSLVSPDHQMQFYQVKVAYDQEIYIGFEGIDQETFSSQDF